MQSFGFSWTMKSTPCVLQQYAFPAYLPHRQTTCFHGGIQSTKKENVCWDSTLRHRSRFCRHSLSTSLLGNFRPLPFRKSRQCHHSQSDHFCLGTPYPCPIAV